MEQNQLYDLRQPGCADPAAAEDFIRRSRPVAEQVGDVFDLVWPTALTPESLLSVLQSWFAFEVKAHGLRGLVFNHSVDDSSDAEGASATYRLFPASWCATGDEIAITFSILPDQNVPVRVVMKFVIVDGKVITMSPEVSLF